MGYSLFVCLSEMVHIEPLVSLLCWLLAAASIVQADSPFELTWSDKSYGPDGPWQAVTVSLGDDPGYSVPMYPGGRWSTYVTLTHICDNDRFTVPCNPASSTLVNMSKLTSATNVSEPRTDWQQYDYSSAPSMYTFDVFYDKMNIGYGTSVPNVSMAGVSGAYQEFPGGLVAPVAVGILSMGAPSLLHEWGETMTFISSYLYSNGGVRKTPSYSYGMHIGSAALGISGSALLGGYDKSRLVGEVSTQSFSPPGATPGGNLRIGLMDIGLGVGAGGSPWAYDQKKGLLSLSNNSMELPLYVEISPARPYLYLPQSACDAITAELPVTFNSSLGLYFWDTKNDSYTTLTSSAAFLSLSFQKDMAQDDMTTIKVPFSLLNLSLEAPLVQQPTPYFPCYPVSSSYSLGRAFIQAAFVGENFGNGNGNGLWYLGQAPGPGASKKEVTSIGTTQSKLSPSSKTWEDTWNGYWQPLPGGADSSNSTNTTSPSKDSLASAANSDLSSGAKAGVGVGCGVAGAILIGALAWIFLARRRRALEKEAAIAANAENRSTRVYRTPQMYPQELESKPSQTQMPVEVPGNSVVRYELG